MDRRKEFAAEGFHGLPCRGGGAERIGRDTPWMRQGLRSPNPVNRHGAALRRHLVRGCRRTPQRRDGAVPGGPPFLARPMEFIKNDLRFAPPLHRAQVSVCYPGYPRTSPDETPAAFGFRLNRDASPCRRASGGRPGSPPLPERAAAYIWGFRSRKPVRMPRRWSLWQGSHRHMGKVFTEALANKAQAEWPGIDLTEAYQAARREVFASLPEGGLANEAGGSLPAPPPSAAWRGALGPACHCPRPMAG